MKFCKKCGLQMDDDAAFCVKCGTPSAVDATTTENNYDQVPQHNPTPQYNFAPQYTPTPQYNPTLQYGSVPVSVEAGDCKIRRTGLHIAAFITSIVGGVLTAIITYGIGLLWIIPMLVVYIVKFSKRSAISTGFKICILIFVSSVGGILALCAKDTVLTGNS